MNEVVITRDSLVKEAMQRLFSDTAIQAVIATAASKFFDEVKTLKISTVGKMLDMDRRTVEQVFAGKIIRSGPRTSRIRASDVREYSNSAT